MENLTLYNNVRAVPDNAKRTIEAGRLKGKTDINPMWRIKALTEQFGPCGVGWKYTLDGQWLERGHGDEVAAFCNISLFVKVGEQWSEAIPGTGGSAFVAKERNGPYTSDECFKMALTDAISVACKALGFGADVYWAADTTKYRCRENDKPPTKPAPEPILCQHCGKPVSPAKKGDKIISPEELAHASHAEFGQVMCAKCYMAERKEVQAATDRDPAEVSAAEDEGTEP